MVINLPTSLIFEGGIQFLAHQYDRVIRSELLIKAGIAQIGGEGTLFSKIKGYLRILYPTGFPSTFEVIASFYLRNASEHIG